MVPQEIPSKYNTTKDDWSSFVDDNVDALHAKILVGCELKSQKKLTQRMINGVALLLAYLDGQEAVDNLYKPFMGAVLMIMKARQVAVASRKDVELKQKVDHSQEVDLISVLAKHLATDSSATTDNSFLSKKLNVENFNEFVHGKVDTLAELFSSQSTEVVKPTLSRALRDFAIMMALIDDATFISVWSKELKAVLDKIRQYRLTVQSTEVVLKTRSVEQDAMQRAEQVVAKWLAKAAQPQARPQTPQARPQEEVATFAQYTQRPGWAALSN